MAVWGNKFSQHENSLYHLRRAAAFALHEDLDLYGRGWESKSYVIKQFSRSLFQSKGKIQEWTLRDALESVKPPPNYRGELISKETKMREYKFALVIENSKDYVSEKLIEAITQGLVPVYVGPKLSDFGLPDNISVNAEPTLASIVEACMYLLKDSEHEHAKLLENAKIFLASENFESFRNDNVLSKLAQDICVHLAGV